MTEPKATIALTSPTAALCLGVSRRMVQHYITRGVLSAHAIKKPFRTHYRISIDSLRAFAVERGIELDESHIGEKKHQEQAIFTS